MKIISKITNRGILIPCYVGNWSATKGVAIELHKFQFCYDDHNRCVRGTRKKYTIGRLVVPSIWHVQKGNDLTQNEVMPLEKSSFLLSEKLRSHPINLFGDNTFVPFNKQTDVNV